MQFWYTIDHKLVEAGNKLNMQQVLLWDTNWVEQHQERLSVTVSDLYALI